MHRRISDANMKRVIVIGGANVDIKGRPYDPYLTGTSNPGDVTLSPGGVGRNIAENLAHLGFTVSLLTVLGNDINGQFLRHACNAAGIDLALAVTTPEPTGTYLAILNQEGEMVSAVSDMRGIDRLQPEHLAALSHRLLEADMLVADCNIPCGCLEWLAAFAVRNGLRLIVEPVSVAKAERLKGVVRSAPVFAITPNARQVETLTGTAGEVALVQLQKLGFANIVVHQGSSGALTFDGQRFSIIDAIHVATIADVTGAGDAAVAGLICGLLDGFDLATSARLGQYAAALKLSSPQSVAMGLTRERLYGMAGI